MSRTISDTYTSTVKLTNTANNPVTLTSTAKLTPSAAAAYALYGAGGTGKAWTITNAGVINAGTNGNGIQLGAGGVYVGSSTITNQAGGTISGAYGIRMYNTAASSITNQAGAKITATNNRAVYFNNTGTLINSGIISAPALNNQQGAVLMESGGTIINNVGGTISGGFGVILLGSGTVTNAGTIAAGSTSAYAVELGSGGGSRLIVDPGAAFIGKVYGGNGTMELASAASAGSLTVTNFTNFNTIAFDTGAQWTLTGSTSNLTGAITGFTRHDTIDLKGFVAVSETFASNALVLTNASAAHATLHLQGSFATSDFILASDGSGGTYVEAACFAAGTRIATTRGRIAVECLREDDTVRLAAGSTAPVQWLGHRRVDCARHPRPWDVWPVRVRAHAFGANRPARDLLLSPDHAVFTDGVLIPVRYLINGASVVQEQVAEVGYWHVELPCHAVLLAEGLACESYLDTGNRAAFENAGAATALHADFAPRGQALEIWQREACAPLVMSGPALVAARRQLIARLPLLGHAITDAPDLRLVVDGAEVEPQRDGRWHYLALPDGVTELRLLSRTAAPAELDPNSADRRLLGVPVVALVLDGQRIALGDARLGPGWHDAEPDLRWTAGSAAIDVRGLSVLELLLAASALRYCVAGRTPEQPRQVA